MKEAICEKGGFICILLLNITYIIGNMYSINFYSPTQFIISA